MPYSVYISLITSTTLFSPDSIYKEFTMSNAYKKTRRCYLIDHHSPQPPIVPLGKMDIQEYKDFFRESGIDSLMVYCKDHWGVTYYDSKEIGRAHV